MSVGTKYATAFTNGVPISGFKNVGKIAIDTNPGAGDYSLGNFVGGVNGSYDYSSYIIISDTTTALVDDRSTGNNTGSALPNQPTFFASKFKTDESFLRMVNRLPARSGQTPFTDPLLASTWLRTNGYWTTYVTPVLSLDAGNTASYPGTGNVWTDTVDGKTFNLINGAGYDPNDGGKFYFYAPAGQYAQSNASLPNLSTWSVAVWHYYTGGNIGSGMCLVTEVYPGSTGKINYSLGDNYDDGDLSSGFFDGAWRTSGTYTLSPSNWYYIVGTYDGTTNNLYINGTLVQSSNYTGNPLSSGGGIRLMRRWDNADYWDGYLATVDIYEEALDSTKISSIFNSTKSRFGL
jgi:hypothetical protein